MKKYDKIKQVVKIIKKKKTTENYMVKLFKWSLEKIYEKKPEIHIIMIFHYKKTS